MRIDAIIVASSEASGLANEIARLWPFDGGLGGSALDLAVVEGLTRMDASKCLWTAAGTDFAAWIPDAGFLGASYCSFRWDRRQRDRSCEGFL